VAKPPRGDFAVGGGYPTTETELTQEASALRSMTLCGERQSTLETTRLTARLPNEAVKVGSRKVRTMYNRKYWVLTIWPKNPEISV